MVLGIENAKDYREKVQQELADLQGDISSSRFAINATTSTYHLHEWLWSKTIKHSISKTVIHPDTGHTIMVNDIKEYKQWLDQNCPHFRLIQELTNGSKHASPVRSGAKVNGWNEAPWDIGPWDTAFLLIDLGSSSSDRYLVASDVISEAGKFMVEHAIKLGA